MLKQLLTFILVLSAFIVNAQQEYRFNKVLYVHQKDSTSRIEFDSLRDICGRIFIGASYIEKRVEGKASQSFFVADRAIKLFVNRHVVYYYCVKLNGKLTTPMNDKNYCVIYMDDQTSTINIGYNKNGVYVIEMYQRNNEP